MAWEYDRDEEPRDAGAVAHPTHPRVLRVLTHSLPLLGAYGVGYHDIDEIIANSERIVYRPLQSVTQLGSASLRDPRRTSTASRPKPFVPLSIPTDHKRRTRYITA